MKEILTDTPIWVWFLFAGLIYLGVKRCFVSTIHIKKLVILPAVFIFMGIRNNLLVEGITLINMTYWIIGGLTGVLLGYWQVKNKHIQANKQNHTITMPGDFFMLIFIIAIFVVEFYIHYTMAANPVIAKTDLFKWMVLLVSGLIVGATIGRNGGYFLKYLNVKT